MNWLMPSRTGDGPGRFVPILQLLPPTRSNMDIWEFIDRTEWAASLPPPEASRARLFTDADEQHGISILAYHLEQQQPEQQQ